MAYVHDVGQLRPAVQLRERVRVAVQHMGAGRRRCRHWHAACHGMHVRRKTSKPPELFLATFSTVPNRCVVGAVAALRGDGFSCFVFGRLWVGVWVRRILVRQGLPRVPVGCTHHHCSAGAVRVRVERSFSNLRCDRRAVRTRLRTRHCRLDIVVGVLRQPIIRPLAVVSFAACVAHRCTAVARPGTPTSTPSA